MAKNNKAPEADDVEFEDLREQFTPIVGFVQRPTKEDPSPKAFSGIVVDWVLQPAKGRFKESFWLVFVADRDQEGAMILDNDGDEHAITKGMRFGVSGTGGLKGLKEKKGHIAKIAYSGKKIPTKNGEMWELDCKVSKKPIEQANVPPPPFG
jgi:hypothetical protein